MITRLSSFLVHTLREDPADAEVPSHKLLVRAGYIRRVAPGIYTLLPLGLKVQRRVEAIVREEMDAIGGQEILLPALLPREPYETSGRWTEYGDALFRLKDRKGNDMLLGPTHEELFASLVKSECSSYKDLPLTLYQVQIKYRDEERPRAGILRGREFVMKDSYSFDLTDEGLEAAYQRHRVAYQRIFDRIGVEYVICAATSGAMGGSASEEFLAIAPSGEDTFVRASESDYAANVEAVITQPGTPSDPQAVPAMTTHTTGDTPTIDSLVEWAQGAGVADLIGHTPQAGDTLKNVVCKVRQPGGEWELYGIGVPGDRAVDMKRLEASLEPAEVQLLEDADFKNYPFLIRGYISPRAIIDNDGTYLVDPRIVEGTAWITGADVAGDHVVNMVCGRDFTPHGTIEAAEVCEGDPAPDNGGVLTLERGIEIGHIFQLGRKYTDAFELDILDADGKRARPTMGSYGIGVSRMVGVVAEQSHDEKGLKWPASIAPFDVHIVIANKAEDAIAGAGELAEQLDARGVAVLLDDRKASPGVKFKDAELLGMPLIVVAGRGWADGVVEVRDRHTGEATEVAVAEIGSYLLERLGR